MKECWLAKETYRLSVNRAGKDSEATQLTWSRPRKVRQRLDDRVGIRQPVKEAEVSGHRTTRTPRGVQNPNCAKTDKCDERVCDYAKSRTRYMQAAHVGGTYPLCKRKNGTCLAGARSRH